MVCRAGTKPGYGSGARNSAPGVLEKARLSGISRVVPDGGTAAAAPEGISDQLPDLLLRYHNLAPQSSPDLELFVKIV